MKWTLFELIYTCIVHKIAREIVMKLAKKFSM